MRTFRTTSPRFHHVQLRGPLHHCHGGDPQYARGHGVAPASTTSRGEHRAAGECAGATLRHLRAHDGPYRRGRLACLTPRPRLATRTLAGITLASRASHPLAGRLLARVVRLVAMSSSRRRDATEPGPLLAGSSRSRVAASLVRIRRFARPRLGGGHDLGRRRSVLDWCAQHLVLRQRVSLSAPGRATRQDARVVEGEADRGRTPALQLTQRSRWPFVPDEGQHHELKHGGCIRCVAG